MGVQKVFMEMHSLEAGSLGIYIYESYVSAGFLGWTVKSKDGIIAHLHLGEYYVFCNMEHELSTFEMNCSTL
jgi:hypothetical protein